MKKLYTMISYVNQWNEKIGNIKDIYIKLLHWAINKILHIQLDFTIKKQED